MDVINTVKRCQNCYMFYFDSVRGIDSNIVKKTNDFNLPIKKDRYGKFKIESGQSLQVCLTSDFLLKRQTSGEMMFGR